MVKERYKCPISVHLILIDNSEILLLKRMNTGFRDGMYALPAGCVEGNESITAAMIRESKEEIGIILSEKDLQFSSVIHGKDEEDCGRDGIAFFFNTLVYKEKVRNCEPHKCEELKFFPLGKLPENLIPYVKCGIENHLSKEYFNEFGWKP